MVSGNRSTMVRRRRIAALAAMCAALPMLVAAAPEIGTFGFDSAGMDTSVKPGDNFYQYAGGTWIRNTPLPADKSSYGMFTRLSDRSEERIKAIIEAAAADTSAPAGSEARKVGDLYRAFMDEATINARGYDPIKPELAAIDKLGSVHDVEVALAAGLREGGPSPVRMGVEQDPKHPEAYIVSVSQGGLGMPDRDFYNLDKTQFEAQRTAYKMYLATLLKLTDQADAEARAAQVFAFESRIAAVHWSRVKNRDPQARYNLRTLDEMKTAAPDFPWAEYVAATSVPAQDHYDVTQPDAVFASAKIIGDTPLPVLKDYMRVMLISRSASEMAKPFSDAQFAFYGKALSGQPQERVRWKRGVATVQALLGEAVGHLYVEKYFPKETKEKADALVHNLLASMGDRLRGLTWMSPATKQRALAKLATYDPKIGYPVKWRDYSALTISPDDIVGDVRRASVFEYNRALAKLGKPVDRTEWGMTPQTVNAYYNPPKNEIVFPAAILQPPFFDANADAAVNYGGIGAVIGHEISHGFDDQGSQYDAQGHLENWWTAEDRAKFNDATSRLVEQYNSYCPFPGPTPPKQCVNGRLTLGENIADLAGLTVAYQAYHMSLKGKKDKVIDGLTGDQRFFLGWSQVWRQNMRDAQAQTLLVSDPHSPTLARTSVVRNLDAWYTAFDVKPGDKLYLDPKDRIKIW